MMQPQEMQRIRQDLGLTQTEFAHALGLSSQEHVSRLETGRVEIQQQTALLLRYVQRFGVLESAADETQLDLLLRYIKRHGVLPPRKE